MYNKIDFLFDILLVLKQFFKYMKVDINIVYPKQIKNKVTSLSEEEKLHEIAWVNVDDKVLLEHVNIIIEVMTKAKKELEGLNDKAN